MCKGHGYGKRSSCELLLLFIVRYITLMIYEFY
nr:MAG TPA: hypothetical protein [Caudoviricetes sp.]